MTDHTTAAQAAHTNPLSDEYVNAVIQQHGYQSPETVIARLNQWIGLHGGENGVTLLMYEAHKALVKLRAPVADEKPRQRPPMCRISGVNEGVLRRAAMRHRAADELQDPSVLAGLADGLESIAGNENAALAAAYIRREADRLASAPIAPQACPTDVCQAGKADGVLCTNDECDRANGVRPASAPVAGEAVAYRVGTDLFLPEALPAAERYAEIRQKPLEPLYAAPQASEAVQLLRKVREDGYLSDTMNHRIAMFFACQPQASEAELKEAAAIARSFGAPDMADALDPPKGPVQAGDAVREADQPVFAFLLGEGPLRGVHFGERAPGAIGKWWWRQELRAALSAQPGANAEPYGWLYDWTHSSATGKPDSHYTGFTTDKAYAQGHDNPRAVYLSAQPGAQKGCNCAACRPHSVEMRMILCEVCGDKRCPHAADHRNACTGAHPDNKDGGANGQD